MVSSAQPRESSQASGMIFNIMRFAVHDGPGIRTAVFLKGCPLDCWWCHNPESQHFQPDRMYYRDRCANCGECVTSCPHSAIQQGPNGPVTSACCTLCGTCIEACPNQARRIAGQRRTAADVLREIERDLLFFDESGGGVTLTGGEPAAQWRFALAILNGCRERGIHSAVETCGYAPAEPFLKLVTAADLVLFDLKLMDPARHKHYTGVSNRRILNNLEALLVSGVPTTVRIPVLPGINDSQQELEDFTNFLSAAGARRISLLPYHRTGQEKYLRLGWQSRMNGTPEPTPDEMRRFAKPFQRTGFCVTIGA